MSHYERPHPYVADISIHGEFVTIEKRWLSSTRASDTITIHRDVAVELAALLNREFLLETLATLEDV